MKFSISNFQSPICRRREKDSSAPARVTANWQLAIGNRKSRQGIALVITLVLLSVTLIMAVAFLALSRRDRNAVATSTDTAVARLAADSALAAAQAQVVANIFSSTNRAAYNFKLLVSTNYQNGNGYYIGVQNPTNVNYDFRNVDGQPLNSADLVQNIANLWYLPRVPVYVNTNSGKPFDFRYYLDLNRNAKFEDSGDTVPNVELDLSGIPFTNGFGKQVGDPQWIGVLEKPDQPHGPNNPFVARYAFLAQPIGNSLDLNHIHNQTLNERDANPAVYLKTTDGFFRNQGVGTWELNLAGFLADLNTNIWGRVIGDSVNGNTAWYYYQYPPGGNRGVSFNDAQGLLSWRLANNYKSLAVANQAVFNPNNIFNRDNVDAYGDGPLQTTTTNIDESLSNTGADGDWNANQFPWAGSDNPNRFFSVNSDLFDKAKTQPGIVAPNEGFADRLHKAGTNTYGGNVVPTYDRYTYYRMLDQLGTDSSADSDKMNLNYDNLDYSGAVVPHAETNMFAWTPLRFFTNAANRMLRYYTTQWATNRVANLFDADTNYVANFSVTEPFDTGNIPVLISNRFVYTPAVNRLLQLAANLFDASTNTFYPSVFRPTFKVVMQNGYENVFISGYTEISSHFLTHNNPPLDEPLKLSEINSRPLVQNAVWNAANANIYGVPWIIGAKKGFPNFNQFVSLNTVQVTRKLQVTRTKTTVGAIDPSNVVTTNQALIMSITNRIGMAFWNSYDTNYFPSGNLIVFGRNHVEMLLTNNQNKIWPTPVNTFVYFNGPPVNTTNLSVPWPGSQWTTVTGDRPTDSFKWMMADYAFIPESQYSVSSANFLPSGQTIFETATTFANPRFGLLTTNHLQAYILDGGRLIDYVHFGSSSSRDLSDEITDKTSNPSQAPAIQNSTSMWDTNVPSGGFAPTKGVINQISVSRLNPAGTIANSWKRPANMPSAANTPDLEAQFFNAFFMGYPVVIGGKTYSNTNRVQQAPYTPTRTAWDYSVWQANDPLVHYLASDLFLIPDDPKPKYSDDVATGDYPKPNLAFLAARYQPWGGQANQIAGMLKLGAADKESIPYDSNIHDPLVWGSDYWDFPSSKYPSVGWIGRVHRGSPWQTIYLKSSNILNVVYSSTRFTGINAWVFWTGNNRTANGKYLDATNSTPVSDSDLFDLFTTRFNDNAARGTLSVNQEHLAAWSAALSGLVVLENILGAPSSSTPPVYTNLIISPAGVDVANSAIGKIVNGPSGINVWRSTMFTNADNTTGYFQHAGDILRVPALSEQSPFLNQTNINQQRFGISDAVYEWLPQQLMGLLRVSTTPRYVIYCYGQALRPAPGSQVLSASIPNTFGMVTNYQVVAESAARAVVRVEKQGTNYNAVVESYNPLPPE